MELARNRRSGPRCPCPIALWLPPLAVVRPDARGDFLGRGDRGRRGARLFWRLDRSHFSALDRNMVVAPASLSLDHYFLDHHPELLRASRHPSVVFLDVALPRRACRVFAGEKFLIRKRRARARALQWSDHRQACLAERDGRDPDVSPIRPQQLDHDVDGARFSRLWLAAGVALAGRTLVAGKVELGGTLARPHWLSGHRDHALAAGLHRRSRA